MESALEAAALRRLRMEAGLTQRALGERAKVAQPNIAAYESGRRRPSRATSDKLRKALLAPSPERLSAQRERILEIARRRMLTDIRVFGSAARGDAHPGSDVDLLVHPSRESSIFDLAGFMSEVEDLLKVKVDVVSDRGTGPAMERIRTEAVPL